MGRVQHTRIERQRRDVLRGTLPGDRVAKKTSAQGRQTQKVGKVGRVGRYVTPKVCWVGRYAYVAPIWLTGAAVVKTYKTGLLAYDYDLLVDELAAWNMSRHDAIEWVHKHVVPLSDLAKPAVRLIYKKS